VSALQRFPAKTQSEILRLAMKGAPAPLAMKGASMLPDLREGMSIDVRERVPKRGDVVVFRSGGRLVAHRAIAVRDDEILCAGDAQPCYCERVARRDVLGVAAAVYDRSGARIDTPLFRMRGRLRALLHPVLVMLSLALPWRRARTYRSLVRTMSAVVSGDARALRSAIEEQPPVALAAMARRHRCAAALCAALDDSCHDEPSRTMRENEYAQTLRRLLRRDRWKASLALPLLRAQALEVVQTLRHAGLTIVLLKGAQRALTDAPEAQLFDSVDLDVLVARGDVEAACAALIEAGYRQHVPPAEYAQHHHAAPLYRPGRLPIEVHRAISHLPLALPIEIGDLRHHVRSVAIEGTEVHVLDDVMTAVHLAAHCMQRPALRELVLLALHLRRLDAFDRRRLYGTLQRERVHAARLHGAMRFAAALAGIEWACSREAQTYADWMLLREDLPLPLRARTACVDAWLAARSSRVSGALRAARDHAVRGGAAARVLRAGLFLAAAPVIAAYAALMRR
jgi:hypothetical protein